LKSCCRNPTPRGVPSPLALCPRPPLQCRCLLSWLNAFRLTFFCRIPKSRNDFVSRLLPAAASEAERPALAYLGRDNTFLPDASYVRRPDQHCSHNCRSTTSPCRRW